MTDRKISKRPSASSRSKSQTKVQKEGTVWSKVAGRWRLVHGSMIREDFALEFHDFSTNIPLDWAESFHDFSMEICINLHGRATFHGAKPFELSDNQVAIYTVPKNKPRATRHAGGRHCFYTLEFSRDWLRDNLKNSLDGLKPPIHSFVTRPDRARPYVECLHMPSAMIPIRIDLLAPPCPAEGADAWYYGKILEILSLTIYKLNEFVNPTANRNRDRMEKVRAMLDQSLELLPPLNTLARSAGVSTFYLCRMFKEYCGVGIGEYHRAIRMERAAQLLREGKSVTETATTLGYKNLSAFIKTFGSYHCTTPSRWAALWQKK